MRSRRDRFALAPFQLAKTGSCLVAEERRSAGLSAAVKTFIGVRAVASWRPFARISAFLAGPSLIKRDREVLLLSSALPRRSMDARR